mgnify:CR=1 FL=1
MSQDLHPERTLAPFFHNKTLASIVSRQSSGKEATVYCCEGGTKLGSRQLVAAKIYRPPERRAFKRHMEYADGRYVQGRTARAALKARNTYGKRMLFEQWIAFEFQVLGRLYRAGVRVPRPIAFEGYTILMEYVGDDEQSAPQLRSLDLDREQSRSVLAEVYGDIETMLSINLIHGDLSAYNILYWEGQPWIIDVPQALDPRVNNKAAEALERDVVHVAEWAEGRGVDADPQSFSTDLWIRWLRGDL